MNMRPRPGVVWNGGENNGDRLAGLMIQFFRSSETKLVKF